MYTKLFSSITDSTIWQAPDPTRLVWITMLAMADKHGYVGASMPGLASRARVSLDDCIIAIQTLLSPDQWSRTKDNDGIRIAERDGGWELLNYPKYRAIRNEDDRREKAKLGMAKLREERKKASVNKNVRNVRNVSLGCHSLTHTEADTEADKELTTLSGEAPTQPIETPKQKPSEAEEALEYLNEKSGSHFKPVKANVSLITARIKDGASLADIKRVIDHKVSEWKTDAKMSVYLRPSTLFNATKYAQYAGQLAPVDRGKGEWFELLGKFETELTPQEKTQVFVARSAAR